MDALFDFYDGLNGDNWLDNSGWLVGDPCSNSTRFETVPPFDFLFNNSNFINYTFGSWIGLICATEIGNLQSHVVVMYADSSQLFFVFLLPAAMLTVSRLQNKLTDLFLPV